MSGLEELESALKKGVEGIEDSIALYSGDLLETEHYQWANHTGLQLWQRYIRYLGMII